MINKQTELWMNEILEDLFKLDPGLKAMEEPMKKVIKELIKAKPEADLDENFELDLRRELLKRFHEKQEKKAGFFGWILKPVFLRFAGGFVALSLVMVVALQFRTQQLQKNIYTEPVTIANPGQPENKPQTVNRTKSSVANPQKELDVKDKDKGKAADELLYDTEETEKSPSPSEAPKAEAYLPVLSKARANSTAGAAQKSEKKELSVIAGKADSVDDFQKQQSVDFNTESYNRITENQFLETVKNPQSTFSADVDTASYANIRRYINAGNLPPEDAVRIEEMINYFHYDYPEPDNTAPFSFNTELSACPWNTNHKLLLIGLQAKKVKVENLPPNNLVFLLDVSGSMEDEDKLPLLKQAFTMLVKELRPVDRVSIVVYAGAAGMVLEPTSGNQKDKILAALDKLEAGGSTGGAEGIVQAYAAAKKYYNKQGNNRVILATDGDFNVGMSSDAEMERLIEQKRKEGIYLSVLGFGTGNYKDSKMLALADKGNGNYSYIDSVQEAQKVLVKQMGGTLFTVAKDVKLQLEFNPVFVKQYRLVGYEKRVMPAEDFNNDAKDAGEIGAGHTVTALYEIVTEGAVSNQDLKYVKTMVNPDAASGGEMMTIKFRYKKPNEDQSILITKPVLYQEKNLDKTSDNFRFAASVAEWGLLLRNSEFKQNAAYNQVLKLAEKSKGQDLEGYRSEFIDLVKNAERITGK